MTTTIYICAALGVIALCAVSYALGWCEGRNKGQLDGYVEASFECRRRCAHARN